MSDLSFNCILLFFGLGTGEIILICLVIMLLLGGGKIAGVMKGLGKNIKSVKDEVEDFKSGFDITGQNPVKENKEQEEPEKTSEK